MMKLFGVLSAVMGMGLAVLLTISDLTGHWETALPGTVVFRLPPLHDGNGGIEGGGVWLENDGPYAAHLPTISFRASTTRSQDAYRVACEVAEKHLHAPGSARFAPYHSARIGVEDGGSTVGIDAYVDAQDRAGAFTRADLRAVVVLSREGEWTIKQMRINTAPENESMLAATIVKSNS